jgi:hypothetical protein
LVKVGLKPEMDVNFCIFWQGNRKSKHCRICAVEGSSCFLLWNAVKSLAQDNCILTNKKIGRAFGHRYQIVKPGKNHCYIQTLQGKMAYFGLPIEDFLYVTKTGLGGMYETPSRTKQNPFVNLILEQIKTDPKIVHGEELIQAVRTIPRKTN